MHQLVLLITTQVYIHSNICRKAAEYIVYLAKTKLVVSHVNKCLFSLFSLRKYYILCALFHSKPLTKALLYWSFTKEGLAIFYSWCAKQDSLPSLSWKGSVKGLRWWLPSDFWTSSLLSRGFGQMNTQGKHSFKVRLSSQE